MSEKKEDQVLNVPCSFGSVGFGKETVRIGVKVDRGQLALDSADTTLCGMRLTGRLTADTADPDQKQLPGMEGTKDSVAGAFDVKSLSVKPDEITFGATFAVQSVDEHALIALRSRTGRMVITAAEALPDDSKSDTKSDVDDHEDIGPMAHKPIRGQKTMSHLGSIEKLGDPGGDLPLTKLVDFGMTQAKVQAIVESIDGQTVGHLEAVMRKDALWHRKIKGFGQTWVDKLTDSLMAFRSRYPVPDQADLDEYEEGYTEGVEDFGFDPQSKNPHPDGTWSARGWNVGFEDAKNMRVKLVSSAKEAVGAGVQVDENTTLSVDDDDDEETDVDDVDNEDADELDVD